MQKSEIIYESLLRVNGGVVTPNMSTRYGEAETYLAAAFNFAQLGTYWVEGKQEGEHTINPSCLLSFDNILIEYSSIRQQSFATLPTPVVALSKGRELEINTQFGQRMIPLTQGDNAIQEYYSKYDKQIKYQLEGTTIVWLWGIENNPLLKYIRPKYIASIADLADDAEILLAADGYKIVLDLLYSWLSGERAAPKQYQEDGKDKLMQQQQ